jgi:enamine deaminase RidA (YjgF/YER057c/UK114 family)
MTKRNAIFPVNSHAFDKVHGYSAAVASGDLLFVSGKAGSRSDGSPELGFAAQVRLAFSSLEATLAAGACTFDHVVGLTKLHIINAVSPSASNPAAFANGYRGEESIARFASESA